MMRVALISYDWGEYCIRLAGALVQDRRFHLVLAEKQSSPHLDLLDPRVQFYSFSEASLAPTGAQDCVQAIDSCAAFRILILMSFISSRATSGLI